ncbi:MAG: hypothetical protein ACI9Z9_002565, partial [Litorivivens sp.]
GIVPLLSSDSKSLITSLNYSLTQFIEAIFQSLTRPNPQT